MAYKKTDYTNLNARILIMTSMGLVLFGVFIIIIEPVLKIEFEPLELFGQKIPAGWSICVLGLVIQIIDKLPIIVEGIKRVRK